MKLPPFSLKKSIPIISIGLLALQIATLVACATTKKIPPSCSTDNTSTSSQNTSDRCPVDIDEDKNAKTSKAAKNISSKDKKNSSIEVLLLTDKRCKICSVALDSKNLLQRIFPTISFKVIDYASVEGKKLFAELNLTFLPVLLFKRNVDQHENFSSLRPWMIQKENYYQLRTKPLFDPTAEICDNQIDDTGNGKIDCLDPTCQQNPICRPEKKRHIEVFVMSQCPFGAQALLAMKEVLKNFKNQITFDPHYIAEKNDDGSFESLHGQSEIDENIRQLCAKKYYPKDNQYLEYIWCRSRDFQSNEWKTCAKGKISHKTIDRCANGKEGKDLFAKDILLSKALEISASPTWLTNNRFIFHGITPEKIKTELCKNNEGLSGCENKLSDDVKDLGACEN